VNTKDLTSATSNILLIGDSGTHKSWFVGSVPGIYVFDFDGGMSINRGRSVEFDTYKDLPPGVESSDSMKRLGLYPYGTAWTEFFKKLQEIGKAIDKGTGPSAIGFDSLTFLSMIAVNNILKDTGHPSPHQGTWGSHHEYFKRIFGQVTAWPVRIIATAHVERKENDLTHVTEKLPLLAGKLAGLIGAFFDEVYYCDAADGKFSLKTTITPSTRQLKSRWGVPDNTETSWPAVAKYFDLAPLAHQTGGPAKAPVPSRERPRTAEKVGAA
jgi:hypothetical protein